MNKLKNIFFAILPFIIIAIIFFSPYNFDYLLKNNRRKIKKILLIQVVMKIIVVDLPVKNSECSKRGKQLTYKNFLGKTDVLKEKSLVNKNILLFSLFILLFFIYHNEVLKHFNLKVLNMSNSCINSTSSMKR